MRHSLAQVEAEQEADKIDKEQVDSAEQWALEEEAKEHKEYDETVRVAESPSTEQSPLAKRDNKWVSEQIEKAKEEFGPDFGKDLSITLEDTSD